MSIKDEVGMEFTGQPDAIFAGLGLSESIALELQHVPHELVVLVVVFDDEDQFIRHGVPEA
jgi:hypothetical protein